MFLTIISTSWDFSGVCLRGKDVLRGKGCDWFGHWLFFADGTGFDSAVCVGQTVVSFFFLSFSQKDGYIKYYSYLRIPACFPHDDWSNGYSRIASLLILHKYSLHGKHQEHHSTRNGNHLRRDSGGQTRARQYSQQRGDKVTHTTSQEHSQHGIGAC